MRLLINRNPLLLSLMLGALMALFVCGLAKAGDTLEGIKSRGSLRCGVSDGVDGFSVKGPDGHWRGMDVDFCRALSAAVLGDKAKVIFVPLRTSERFPALKSGDIDVLVRNTTWTLEREATLEVLFAGTLYYDGQGFLVPGKSAVTGLSQLDGKTICVIGKTTHEADLKAVFHDRNLHLSALVVESQEKAAQALFAGQCEAFTSESFQLKEVQLKAPGGPSQFTMLPGYISKDAEGPVVRRGDDEWFTIVRWVLFTLIRAEELGVTQNNVQSRLGRDSGSSQGLWSDEDGLISRSLQLQPDWKVRALEAVGNYGEMFERNLGEGSPLKLERGMNRLYDRGGLMYSPSF